jgi:diguanylate cyclase (GGDEF)-like protein
VPARFHERWQGIAAGLLALTVVSCAGLYAVRLSEQRGAADRRSEALAAGAALASSLAHELSSVLYLSNGLRGYLVVHRQNLRREEIQTMLSILHASSRHVRNFGVAVGYRLEYVHPLAGNEQAIGIYYPDLKNQWPEVKRAIDRGVPVLAGPLDLVQGGRGLIYRVPISIDGAYWGLLSTVVDFDAMTRSALAPANTRDYEFAVRWSDAAPVLGDQSLFLAHDVAAVEAAVPGGVWQVAARRNGRAQSDADWLRALVLALAVAVGWSVYLMLDQRRRFARLALFDPLTGLPNRRLVEDRFDRAAVRRRREGSGSLAVLFVDLDGFKSINDRFGHKAGDTVLRVIAVRLLACMRDVDTVGRWGGDEFILILEEAALDQIPALIERVRQAIEAPTRHDERDLSVGASIGAAVVPEERESLPDAIRLADSRMYEDKKQRKARPPAGR